MLEQGKHLDGSISRQILIAGLATLGTGLALGNSGCTSPSASPQTTTAFIYKGHTQPVNALTWSPDSKRIASSGGYDKMIQVWSATIGQHILTHHHGSDNSSYRSLNAVAWSPDGRYISSSDGAAQAWDADSGDMIFTDNATDTASLNRLETHTVAWSSDNKYLALGGVVFYSDSYTYNLINSETRIWDIAQKRMILLRQDHPDLKSVGEATSIAWSSDNKHIASANRSKIVEIWDTSNGSNDLVLSGHSSPITSVAWSPDGNYIASGSYDATVRIWDAVTGKHIFTYSGHPYAVYAVAWSPDSKYIVSGSYDKTAQVWTATTGKHIFTFTGHSNYVYAVAWSPDSKHIASGGQDKTVQVWQPS